MTSETVTQLLADLEITQSHSRPKGVNDNHYSEAWIKTLKYHPVFPERFGSLADAQQFMDHFVQGYNHHHRHTGIGLHTAADVHCGLARASAPTAKQPWPPPGPDIPNGSPPPPAPRSSTCQTPPGCTNPNQPQPNH